MEIKVSSDTLLESIGGLLLKRHGADRPIRPPICPSLLRTKYRPNQINSVSGICCCNVVVDFRHGRQGRSVANRT